jgi:hypothetical protein
LVRDSQSRGLVERPMVRIGCWLTRGQLGRAGARLWGCLLAGRRSGPYVGCRVVTWRQGWLLRRRGVIVEMSHDVSKYRVIIEAVREGPTV